MKHFFFVYKKSFNLDGSLREYVNQESVPVDAEALKVYYDVTDIISDKRFEQNDKLLEVLVEATNTNTPDSDEKEPDSKIVKHFQLRLQGLKALWDIVERQYKLFTTDNKEILYNKSIYNEHADRQYEISMMLVLYHLVRGNLCLRIAQCHYENFDLDASDSWAAKGIEIFWHGKNLVATLRDSAELDKKIQADLYLRLTKLNLAKYYRDYARKNRRSDFDAALDEYEQVRYRMEKEYEHANSPEQKRQYVLIWMDAIINIANIHRRKYQIDTSEKEILFLYNCLRSRLQTKNLAIQAQKDSDKKEVLQSLLEKADKVISGREKQLNIEGERLLENDVDLLGLKRESFVKYDDLEDYDRGRYFLLVLLEFARIQRDLHCVDNYRNAIAIAIIADQWSYELDKSEGYIPGHNIDAFITISSSLRKYIKFQDVASCTELEEIVINIDENKYQLKIGDSKENVASLSCLIDKLIEFADKGHLKSKAEVIKWRCLYKQEPKLLDSVKDKVGGKELPFKIEKSNCQLQFMSGLLSLRSEKYEDAIGIFTDLLEQNKKEMQYIRLGTLGLKTRYLLANCYMSRAEFAKAEKILRELRNTLADAQRSRKSQGVEGSTDAETDARVEIDLGYCCMQRGAYEEAIDIYKGLYGDGGSLGEEPDFGLHQVKRQRRIMGLNNYASSCIFSIDDEKNGEVSKIIDDEENGEMSKIIDDEENEKVSKIKEKIETARRIFCYMDTHFASQDNEKEADRYEWNPETNLLKGYYTLCTGIEPGVDPITDEQIKTCQDISEAANSYIRSHALLVAFPYFKKACRFEEAFTSRYDLLDEHDMGNKARYRNEVERISVYIICLTKLHKLYLSKKKDIEEANERLKESGGQGSVRGLFGEGFEITKQQLEYLTMSNRNLKRILLHFPANYKISLKAAIALAEWLLNNDKMIIETKMDEKKHAEAERLQNQLYRSFSYITIYEERGAGVFNTLRNNGKFRFFTAAQRGKFCALLLAMYKPIKALKEDCCFNIKDQKRTPYLVHYTSMETLKKMLTGEPRKEDFSVVQAEYPNIKDSKQRESEGSRHAQKDTTPRFRINNCGYMNDVFEGKVFLKSMAFISKDITSMKDPMQSQFVEKYFPQINRSQEDLLPSGSNVYIGSLSVKADSFPMWNGYSEKESGCNIEFGKGFFDINGIPYLPKVLRDYTLSKYTDQDYPLYIVQYIGSQFETLYKDYEKNDKYREEDFETFRTHGHRQSCGTEAICYNDLFRILQQINWRWKELDKYLEEKRFENAVGESKNVIRAFAADRINEIRFLFKDADYEYEGEVRVIYTDSAECSDAEFNMESEVPCVYVDIERELENLTIRLASRIEDATVDKYVTWLKHTKRVEKVELAKQNRYTT